MGRLLFKSRQEAGSAFKCFVKRAKFAQKGSLASMLKERAIDLARRCTDLIRIGKAFPTVWDTVLKGHPLVEGIPRQKCQGTRSLLYIPLITGERLIFDGDAKEFRLE